MRKIPFVRASCAAGALWVCAGVASGHGIVGNRFFPPTIATDDPFAADELAFPTVSWSKNAGGDEGPANHQIDAGFEFDKLILPRFSVAVADTYTSTKPGDAPWIKGWNNLEVTAKYELWLNAPHEAIVSVGLGTEIGGTGNANIGAASFTTFSPTLYFGKGFGDLPDSMGALKPFALTGELAQTFPTSSRESNAFEYGFAIEYSLPYLRQQVKDVGLPAPFKDMIPLVEFAFSTPENRGDKGLTTGTVNPGVLWETPYFQLGAEANIPINGRSGAHVGATVQIWIYIDDLFPKTFGNPLFAGD